MVGDAGEHIGERSPRIDGVEFGRGDQRVDHRGALAIAVKSSNGHNRRLRAIPREAPTECRPYVSSFRFAV